MRFTLKFKITKIKKKTAKPYLTEICLKLSRFVPTARVQHWRDRHRRSGHQKDWSTRSQTQVDHHTSGEPHSLLFQLN